MPTSGLSVTRFPSINAEELLVTRIPTLKLLVIVLYFTVTLGILH